MMHTVLGLGFGMVACSGSKSLKPPFFLLGHYWARDAWEQIMPCE